MRQAMVIVAFAMLFSGCIAKMEKLPGSVEKLKYAPTNATEQYGLISYDLTDGDDAREDAYKKMCSSRRIRTPSRF